MSELTVGCVAPTARETAIGIGDAILRLLESHRTYNWILNPFKVLPIVSHSSGLLALVLLVSGSARIVGNRQQGLYLLSGAAFFGWLSLSAAYFRPLVSFDTRR